MSLKTTIAKLSNEKLEQEIANIYMTAHKEVPHVKMQESEGSLLEKLWKEFDSRYEKNLIERNPISGDEVDDDDFYN